MLEDQFSCTTSSNIFNTYCYYLNQTFLRQIPNSKKCVKKIIRIRRITSTVFFLKKIVCQNFLKMHASLNIICRMRYSWNTNVVLLVYICQIYFRFKSENTWIHLNTDLSPVRKCGLGSQKNVERTTTMEDWSYPNKGGCKL